MKITSLPEILNLLGLLFDKWLVNLLAEVIEQPLLDLPFENLVFIYGSHEVLSFNGKAPHLCVSFVNKAMPLRIAYLEAADVGAHSELDLVKLPVIDFVPHIVVPLLNKQYLEGLIHFLDNNLIFVEDTALKRVHYVCHEYAVFAIIKCKVGKFYCFLFTCT